MQKAIDPFSSGNEIHFGNTSIGMIIIFHLRCVFFLCVFFPEKRTTSRQIPDFPVATGIVMDLEII